MKYRVKMSGSEFALKLHSGNLNFFSSWAFVLNFDFFDFLGFFTIKRIHESHSWNNFEVKCRSFTRKLLEEAFGVFKNNFNVKFGRAAHPWNFTSVLWCGINMLAFWKSLIKNADWPHDSVGVWRDGGSCQNQSTHRARENGFVNSTNQMSCSLTSGLKLRIRRTYFRCFLLGASHFSFHLGDYVIKQSNRTTVHIAQVNSETLGAPYAGQMDMVEKHRHRSRSELHQLLSCSPLCLSSPSRPGI